MKDGESEFEVRFGVAPFFDVPKIEHRRFSAFPYNKKTVLTSFRVNEGRGIRTGQYIRTKLARRASTSGSNWPEGPVSQDQTGPKGQNVWTKLARRASTSGQNWPKGPVYQGQTAPKGQYISIKLALKGQ